MKVCSKCNAEFEESLNFCRNDGTALKAKVPVKLCHQCGNEAEKEARFCRSCGASLDPAQQPAPKKEEVPVTGPEERAEQSTSKTESFVEVAETYLKAGNCQAAISTLEPVVKNDPGNRQAYLLHLLASVKLYNIYGYERQIESIKTFSNLTEKEKGIAREIFLITSEAAQKRGRGEQAREYQHLATRVILGQSLAEKTAEARVEEPPLQKMEVKPPARQIDQAPKSRARPIQGRVEQARPMAERSRPKKRISRLFVSFLLVFGLAGVLVAGMLGYYAKKQGVEIKDLFATKPPPKQQLEEKTGTPSPAVVAQVLGAEELGFKVWGAGASDANRQGVLISERIESQLTNLRELYQQEVQQKPDLMGSVTLQLTISPSGMVTKVQDFASRIKDKEFKKLVIDEAYKWRFPEASSGLTKVNYPFLFVPPGMDVASLVKWEQVVGPKGSEPAEPKEPAPIREAAKRTDRRTPLGPTPAGTADVPTPPAPPSPTTGGGARIVIGPYEVLYPTSVYSEPRADSRQVASVDAGTKVNVVDVQGDWLEVRSRQGRPPGFIKKDSAMPMGSR